jgi:hypothetical protein
MRKITEESVRAFNNRQRFNKGNTIVVIDSDGEAYMYLFGKLIAKTCNGDTLINHCGYKTDTTRERLNGFNVTIRLSKETFIVNEQFEWEEGWLNINTLR